MIDAQVIFWAVFLVSQAFRIAALLATVTLLPSQV